MRNNYLGLANRMKETMDALNRQIAAQKVEIDALKVQLQAAVGPVVRTVDMLPPSEQEVFILVRGRWRVGELRWERPGFEDTFQAFQYWDDPEDDGQDWEWYDVTHWCSQPAIPEPYDPFMECEEVEVSLNLTNF